MPIVSKKGNMLSDNSLGLILAVAVVFLLIYLLVNLFSPTFDETNEIAGSYFKSFKMSIDEADSMDKSSFFMLDLGDKDKKFYLVDFNDTLIFSRDDKDFIRSNNKGPMCICYWENEKVLCKHCMKLDSPVVYEKTAPWVVGEGIRMSIAKEGGVYDIRIQE